MLCMQTQDRQVQCAVHVNRSILDLHGEHLDTFQPFLKKNKTGVEHYYSTKWIYVDI